MEKVTINDVLNASIKDLLKQIEGNRDLEEIMEGNEFSIQPHVNLIKSELEEIQKRLNGQPKSEVEKNRTATQLLGHLQNAQSAANFLMSTLTTVISTITSKIKQAVQNAINWVTSHLIPWLQNLWSAIWGVIQNLITPKSWKLAGELGTGVLGFAKASIEIEF